MSKPVTRATARHLALVAALDAGLVAALYALEPSIVTDTVRSPRALGLVALTVVACMVLGRFGRRWAGSFGGALGAALPLALVGWLVIAPAVRDVTLVEPLPAGIDALAVQDTPSATSPPLVQSDVATSPPSAASPQAAVPPRTTASSAPSPRTSAPSATKATSAPTSPAAPASSRPAPSRAAPAPPPSGPAKVSSGRVEGINHTASGTVAIYRLGDGSHIVRFEDVALEGAPDPVLWLVPGRDKRSRDGGLEVGPLKATHGSFHHVVPAGFDVTQDLTVFIWCERYATPIANATQNRL